MKSEYRYSAHACRRQAQRGITTKVADLLLRESDQEIPVGSGSVAIWISHGRIRELQAEGVDMQALGRVSTVIAVLSSEGQVVSTLMRTVARQRARRYRRGAGRGRPAARRPRRSGAGN